MPDQADQPDFPPLELPDDFQFGVATAAYQIEGSVYADGRGASIWDTFSHTPGRVENDDNGDVACDHYARWEKDLDLVAELGVDAYRFSIAWPRLFSRGQGQLNTRGLAFYDRLIDGCLERNLRVFPTLYHWDLPQALADKGGWMYRGTGDAFAEYAATVMDHLGDRIDTITTFNEPWCSAILGHLVGIHAPGERNLDNALAVVHGQHRAHGLATQALRASRDSVPVGIVLNAQAIHPGSDTDDDQQAAIRHETFHNELFFDPLFNGNYPPLLVDALGDRLPTNWQDDMDTIKQPLDFWGLNYYTPIYVTDAVKPDEDFPATTTAKRPTVPRTDIGWEIDPDSLKSLLLSLHQQYQLPPCYITENGAAYNHELENGQINDQPRINYVRSHLQAVAEAVKEGIEIRGYFAWSLMDNFEWAEGYAMRFGMIHVDYATQARTFKASAHWYKSVLEEHRAQRS